MTSGRRPSDSRRLARGHGRTLSTSRIRHSRLSTDRRHHAARVARSEWLAALPEDTKEQRRTKEIFRTNCTACHSPTHALQNRFDENGWRAVIMFMETHTGTGGINRHSTVVHHRDDLARYLASVRGPSSPPLKFKLQPRPTGDATRVVVTEYDIPLAGARSRARVERR